MDTQILDILDEEKQSKEKEQKLKSLIPKNAPQKKKKLLIERPHCGHEYIDTELQTPKCFIKISVF